MRGFFYVYSIITQYARTKSTATLNLIKLTLIKINAKFNRTLFTEDFETVGFYLKEIQQSLTKLCSLPHQNEEQIVFMVNIF
ncbi:MAG: primosomal replication protein PriC [Haemophilus parainfluenzae]